MQHAENTQSTNWHAVLLRLLAPLARFALRHGLKIQEIEAALSESLVQQAQMVLAERAHEQSTSRLSIMTGIHRREISRQLGDSSGDQNPSLIGKVLGHWQHSQSYLDREGKPGILSAGFDDSQFNQLVREVSKELNPAVVLFELQRVGVVSMSTVQGVNYVALIKGSFSPSDGFSSGIEILASDINDLIFSVEENITAQSSEKNLHARTVFDNVRVENVDDLKRWIRAEGHEFHRRLREKLAELDDDINPQPERKGERIEVIVGSFGRIVKR